MYWYILLKWCLIFFEHNGKVILFNREEVISVITSVRKQRGGLSGMTINDIVAEARVFAARLIRDKVMVPCSYREYVGFFF